MPTQASYDEARTLAERNICSECQGALVIDCDGDVWFARCGRDKEHKGFSEIMTATQVYRRGGMTHPAIANRIEAKMARRGVAYVRMVIERFPSANLDQAQAAVFLLDCAKLDLDPFLGEIIPISFKNRNTGKPVVQPIITEDGWLSLAARACPEGWLAPPAVEPVTDPELKMAVCEDREAWVWKATGRRRDWPPEQPATSAYGWFTKKDHQKAKTAETPAADLPGNQARVRAIKRWTRENFPEARAKMRDITMELLDRAEGVEEALVVLEAEYAIKGGPSPALPGTTMTAPVRTTGAPQLEEVTRRGASLPKVERPIKDLDALFRIAQSRWKLSEREALQKLGYSQRLDVNEPADELYERLAAVVEG